MKIIQQSLQTDTMSTKATLTAYIKDPDLHANQTILPAIVFVPGGSYTHIPTEQAESVALAFSAAGYQVFVLRYSFTGEVTPLLPAPLIELGRSVSLIKQRATEWHLDPDQITIMGFSVGGHIVSLYNDYWNSQFLAEETGATNEYLKPKSILLGYPVINFDYGFPADKNKIQDWTGSPEKFASDLHVNQSNRPTFIWVTADDQLVPVKNALRYIDELSANNINFEFHVFDHGPHGMALADHRTAWKPAADNPHVAHWFNLALEWLQNK